MLLGKIRAAASAAFSPSQMTTGAFGCLGDGGQVVERAMVRPSVEFPAARHRATKSGGTSFCRPPHSSERHRRPFRRPPSHIAKRPSGLRPQSRAAASAPFSASGGGQVGLRRVRLEICWTCRAASVSSASVKRREGVEGVIHGAAPRLRSRAFGRASAPPRLGKRRRDRRQG